LSGISAPPDWLIQYVKENSIPKISVPIYLFCAKGKEGFYEKHGFADSCKHGGVGMFMDIDVCESENY